MSLPRLVLSVCAMTLTALALTTTPALAAAPETPKAEPVTAVTPTTATLNGVLNPGGASEGGSYQFSYAPSEALECAGGGVAPLSPALSVGAASEAVSAPVTELQPNREYAVCLTAFSLFFNEPSAPSPAVSFKTPAAAPSVDTESTSAVSSTAATLEAQVNPNNESTSYAFEYSTEQSGGVLGGTIVTVPAAPGGPLEGFGDQTASVPTGALLPDTTYFYRVVTTNATGTTDGTVSETGFTTVATPKTEAATAVTSTTATFHGTLTPLTETPGAEAEFSFAYAQGAEDCTSGTSTPPTPVGTPKAPQPVEAEVTGLQPGATYSVCLVSQNPFGSEVDPAPQVSFTTLAGPPSIESETATGITPEGVTLETTVDPNNQETTCSFEYSSEKGKVEEGKGTVAGCSQPLGAGNTPATGTATVTGLDLKTVYFYRALAENTAHEKTTDPTIEQFETETALKPTLEGETATNVTETTATLGAKINPNGAQITNCTFEYGTETGYGHTAPCAHPDAAEVGAGRTPIPVSAALTGLSPNVTYHWRLAASSAAGTETGIDHTFIDEAAAGLPDGRAYELVTPAHKNEGLVGFAFGSGSGWPPQIAADGSDMITPSIPCFANTQSCTADRIKQGEPYEFARTPSEGWVTHALAPPLTKFEESSLYAADPVTHTALFSAPTPPAGEGPDHFYIGSGVGEPLDIGPVGENSETFQRVEQMVATRGFSHVVYSGTKLWSLDGAPESEFSLYEYAGTGNHQPLPVGVTGPEGSTTRVAGCPVLGAFGQGGNGGIDQYGSLSESGRTVYFTAGFDAGCGTAPEELYGRVDGESSDAHTVEISRPVPSSCSGACQSAPDQGGTWAGASNDGSRVLFTSKGQLTDNASQSTGKAGVECQNAAEGGCNLYESICAEPCGKPGEEPAAKERELVDLSEGAKETGGPRVQGVMALSPDGSHVYFVARGVLTKTPNAQEQTAKDGANNLYVHIEGQPLKFVAALPQDDENVFPESKNAFEWIHGNELANVTPDGRFLVFLSHGALTPDDTRPDRGGNSATPPAQVYRYDSQTGAIVRISIGEHGFNDNGNSGTLDAGIALADGAFELGVGSARANPTMSDNGEYVFFESHVALAPGALNEVEVPYFPETEGRPPIKAFAENVYEYHDGTVSLISDGRDTSPKSIVLGIPSSTQLLGSSESGADVFFATDDALTSQDTDTQRDYYDARICTVAEPCFTPPSPPSECHEEGCRGAAPAPPATQTPGSRSFTGPGNLTPPPAVPPGKSKPPLTKQQKLVKALKACRTKHNRHKRVVCEKQARKQSGLAPKAKKSIIVTNDRRATR